MEGLQERNAFRCQFHTEHQVITGEVSTLHRRMVDFLNVGADDHFVVENVLVPGEANTPADAVACEKAHVRLGSLLFVVLDENESAPPPSDPARWIKKIPHRVTVGVGPYRITGLIHLAEGFGLTELLWSLPDRFLVITEAMLAGPGRGSVAVEHSVVFVSRQRMDFMIPEAT